MEEKNKEVIRRFYQEFFNDHIVDSADRYVREDYVQHNPGVEQGRDGLKRAFAEKFREHPEFALDIQMLIAENDMVAVYLKNVAPDGNRQDVVSLIFTDWKKECSRSTGTYYNLANKIEKRLKKCQNV